MRKQSGFTLIEVLLASGILSALILSTMHIIGKLSRNAGKAQNTAYAQEIISSIDSLLNSYPICRQNFVNTPRTISAASSPVTIDITNDRATPDVLYSAGDIFHNGIKGVNTNQWTVRIDQLTLSNSDLHGFDLSDGVESAGFVEVFIQLSIKDLAKDAASSASYVKFKKYIYVYKDASNVIQECMDWNGMTEEEYCRSVYGTMGTGDYTDRCNFDLGHITPMVTNVCPRLYLPMDGAQLPSLNMEDRFIRGANSGETIGNPFNFSVPNHRHQITNFDISHLHTAPTVSHNHNNEYLAVGDTSDHKHYHSDNDGDWKTYGLFNSCGSEWAAHGEYMRAGNREPEQFGYFWRNTASASMASGLNYVTTTNGIFDGPKPVNNSLSGPNYTTQTPYPFSPYPYSNIESYPDYVRVQFCVKTTWTNYCNILLSSSSTPEVGAKPWDPCTPTPII